MRQVFIPDTNNKYSIREDGTVIRHYEKTSNQHIATQIVHRDSDVRIALVKRANRLPVGRVLLYIDNKMKEIRPALLVLKYFSNYENVDLTNNTVIFKDGDVLNCALTNMSLVKKRSNVLGLDRAPTAKENNDYSRNILSRRYIANLLGISTKDLTDELYKHHKKLVQLKRSIVTRGLANMESLNRNSLNN